MVLKSASFISSAVVHGTIALFFVTPWTGGSALEMGDGEDQFIAEQGISIEGVGFGASQVTTEAVEETPMEMSAARPEIEEEVAPEPVEEQPEAPLEALPDDTQVVTSESEAAPALEAEPERKKEEVVKQEKPQEVQVATIEQQARIAVKEEHQSGAKKRGGDATKTAKALYKKALWKKIVKRAVGNTTLVGLAVVRIEVSDRGELLKSKLVKSSGHKKLDKLALRNVRSAAPFDSLPTEISGEPFVARVPFKFSVRKRKKRSQ